MIVPFLIKGHGLFTLIDDFNFQQIPFNIQSNQAIKTGNVLWNWYTDLGSNFIGAYSFYTLGSPYFWLTLFFSSFSFPYLIGPLLILKYCVAGLTAYAYIERYVKNKNTAIIGSLLYAFSGFSTVNLMFNHFHDVISLFPLLLLGMDKLMCEKKIGWFAIAVSINAVLNYFFFIGELVFLCMYFVVRYLLEDFKGSLKPLLRVAFEGVLGIGISSIIFVPSLLFTLQNPRTSSFLYGSSSLIYDGNRYLMLLRSFLFPADIMAGQASIQPLDYTSSSAYLPLVGVALVVSAFISSKYWSTKLIKVCALFAFIPFLNSIFYVFNATYYARWFYMPVLIMATISARVLDDKNRYKINKGIWITTAMTILFASYLLFYPTAPHIDGFILQKHLFLFYFFTALLGLLLLRIYVSRLMTQKTSILLLIITIVVISSLLGFVNIYKMQHLRSDLPSARIYNIIVKSSLSNHFSINPLYRVNNSTINSNYSMVSSIPTVNSFTSTVNGSIFKFYDLLGAPRVNGNASVPPAHAYGLEPLLSEKYQITSIKQKGKRLLQTYRDGKDIYYLYENKYYLPIGFGYTHFITTSQLEHIPVDKRDLILLKAIVVPKEKVPLLKNCTLLPAKQRNQLSIKFFKKDFNERKKISSTNFSRNQFGFYSTIKAAKGQMAFYSIPYDNGWHASVNGKKVNIVESEGFMSVPLNKGKNIVNFRYVTPGLLPGIAVTLTSILLLLIYIVCKRKKYNIRRSVV